MPSKLHFGMYLGKLSDLIKVELDRVFSEFYERCFFSYKNLSFN